MHVFDLFINKYKANCVQQIIPKKKGKLNHIVFNACHPVIIVGDSMGQVKKHEYFDKIKKIILNVGPLYETVPKFTES